jgi:hypothetical protein
VGVEAVREGAHQCQRGLVVRQHRGGEAADAAVAARVGELVGQPLAQPAALEVVGHDDRRLGRLRVALVANEAGDADDRIQVVEPHCDDRVVVVPVHLGEVAKLAVAEPRLGRQEAPPHGLVGEVGAAVLEQDAVGRPDLADHDPYSVLKSDQHGSKIFEPRACK